MKNYVQLIGRCGDEPEVRTFESGKVKARMSLMTTVTSRDAQGNTTEVTTWHKIVGWESVAKRMSEHLRKGTPAFVQGRLNYGSYENKEGQKVNYTEIVAERVELLQP